MIDPDRSPGTSSLAKRAKGTILWGLGITVLLQVSFYCPLSQWWPQLYDPEFGGKLARLRHHIEKASTPQRLVLVLGSSHTGMGVRPGILSSEPSPATSRMLLFNCSINGGTPLVSLLNLRRLLNDGIKPDWVLVETCPVQLWWDGPRAKANNAVPLVLVQGQDLPMLERYYGNPHQLRVNWRKIQWFPWYFHRDYLLSYFWPDWRPRPSALQNSWENVDEWGWQWVAGYTESYQTRGEDLESIRRLFTSFYQQFEISDVDNRALREILETCRERKINVAFLRMPEAVFFQSWYPARMVEQVDDYLHQLNREYHVPMIDARDWVADGYFADGHHLTPRGAEIFTKRLDQEVLQYLSDGQSPPVFDSKLAESPR
jgi:hypothetical protein